MSVSSTYVRRIGLPLSSLEFNIERTPISSIATKFIHGPVEKTMSEFFTYDE